MTTQRTPAEQAHHLRWLNGKEPNQFPDPTWNGQPRKQESWRRWAPTEGFKTRDDLARAMADPRYKNDADYRQGIAEMLADSPRLTGTLGTRWHG